MSPPPGQQPTSELCGEHITAAGDTDLATRNGQMRYLMRELGVTRPQAHRLIVAYERDQAAPIGRSAQKSYRPGFIDWLMRQAPVERRRRRQQWRVGDAGGPWAVTSS